VNVNLKKKVAAPNLKEFKDKTEKPFEIELNKFIQMEKDI
jgi:hypothetical protein